MNKTIREALIIMLVTLLLALAYSILSPVGRILLKKGLHMSATEAIHTAVPEGLRSI